MTTNHTATVYAIVKATRSRFTYQRDPETGLGRVEAIKVERITQTYPRTIHPDTVVVKLELQVPESAFAPLVPNAVIAVPESMIDQPVHIEAVPPSDGDER